MAKKKKGFGGLLKSVFVETNDDIIICDNVNKTSETFAKQMYL